MTAGSATQYYPVFLSLHNRPCLVVGGGTVATGKVKGLLAAGARVSVISPELAAELQTLATEGRIEHQRRVYADGDANGKALVIAATNDSAANARVASDCRAQGVWVNSADDPPNCDFILPSVIRKGKVTLAASTAGASPALARRLREELEDFLSDDLAALADLLGEVRRELQNRGIAIEPDRWQQAIDSRLRALLAQRRPEEARARLLENLGVPATQEERSPS